MKFCIPQNIERSSGVYFIKSAVSNDLYIGATNNFHKRFIAHKSRLLGGTHSSKGLQGFVNKNGIDVLSFELYKHCAPKDKHKYESAAIAEFNPSLNKNSTRATIITYSNEGRVSVASEQTIAALIVVKGRRQISELSKLSQVSAPTIDACASGSAIRTFLIRKIEDAILLLPPPASKKKKIIECVPLVDVPIGALKYLKNALQSYGGATHIMRYSDLSRYALGRIAFTKKATIEQVNQLEKAMDASKSEPIKLTAA